VKETTKRSKRTKHALVIDSINITTASGKSVKLTILEARDLRRELNQLFSTPTIPSDISEVC